MNSGNVAGVNRNLFLPSIHCVHGRGLLVTRDPETFGYYLDWKEFEAFSESIFESFGYATSRNFRLKKPRIEVDLLAARDSLAFAVDCKHWKRTVGHASMTLVSERQVARAVRIGKEGLFDRIIPVILTWRDESLYVLENRVPVVPIHRLSDFILNWDQSNQPILTISGRKEKKTSSLNSFG